MRKSIACLIAVLAMAFLGGQLVRAEEGNKPPKPKSITGPVKSIEGKSLTIIKTGERGSAEDVVVTLGNTTEVVIETDEDQDVPGEGGGTRKRPMTRSGEAGDLKPGRRVQAAYNADGTAVRVLVLREKKKTGGEGEK